VDNVLLSVQNGQVLHSFLCYGRAQDRFDSLHMAEASFTRQWNSLTVTIKEFNCHVPVQSRTATLNKLMTSVRRFANHHDMKKLVQVGR